jgi:hypothetical protein
MNLFKTMTWTLALALPLTVGLANASQTTPYPFNAPGIVEPSYPYYLDTKETISMKKIGSGSDAYWRLTGSGSAASFFGAQDNNYNLKNEKIKYVANFDANGNLITSIGNKTLANYLEIKGSLPAGQIGNTSWDRVSNQLLLRADLLDSNVANDDPDLIGTYDGWALGFKTKFTDGWVMDQSGLTGGSTGESLWLFGQSHDFQDLVNALDGDESNGTLRSLIDRSKTIERVSSVSSVPVPAAAWLFGTGLVTLLAKRRKNVDM